MQRNSLSLTKILGIGIVLFAGVGVIILSQQRTNYTQHAAANGNVNIDYTTIIQKLDPKAIGLDISGYFTPLAFGNDTVEQQKVKQLGPKYLRMHLIYQTSGDPTSKIICGGGGCNTTITGDQWINAIKSVGAEPVVIVYTKSAVDAANMVKHFNKDTNNPVKYWIVGNEPNINGYSVQSYSDYFNADYDAMKAIDPTIKIGGGTTAWYDQTWLQQFLQLTGSKVDFVDFHGYPQQGTTDGDYTKLFQNADGYGNDVTKLRAVINSTVPSRASQIAIEVGEWELNWGGSAQNNINFHSVWAATAFGGILKAGGYSMFYADKGNLIYGSPHTFIDSTGKSYSVVPDDTNPAYHGIGMFTGEGLFQHFGDTMVSATTTFPNIEVFASDNPKNIVLINKDPSTTQLATVAVTGLSSGTFDVWRKDESISPPNPPVKIGTVSIQNGTFTYQLTPFSVTTFVLTSAQSLSTTPSGLTITPTTSASISPTIAPTAGANDKIFSLTICPHGLGNCGDNVSPNGGNTIPIHTTRTVTLTILNGSSQPVGTTQGSIIYNPSAKNFQGTVVAKNLPPGNYLLTTTLPGFLSQKFPGFTTVTSAQTISLPVISLITGNTNNDGQLDILDYNLITSCFGSKSSSSSCTNKLAADINDDGKVDAIDYNLFLRELSVQRGE